MDCTAIGESGGVIINVLQSNDVDRSSQYQFEALAKGAPKIWTLYLCIPVRSANHR